MREMDASTLKIRPPRKDWSFSSVGRVGSLGQQSALTRYRLVGVGLDNFTDADDPRLQAGLFD